MRQCFPNDTLGVEDRAFEAGTNKVWWRADLSRQGDATVAATTGSCLVARLQIPFPLNLDFTHSMQPMQILFDALRPVIIWRR